MKYAIKYTFTAALCFSLMQMYAQNPTTPFNNSVAIKLQNLSANAVTLFIGPQDELVTPIKKQKTYPAQSTGTVYATVNQTVCIINQQQKPISCINVMAGVTEIEINKTGTEIKNKD